MKYNWPAAIKELKQIVLEHTVIHAHKDQNPKAWAEHLRHVMFDTDQFHPYGSDDELSRALNRMPDGRCNYSSVESYWLFKYGREGIADALYLLIVDMGSAIEEYYTDKWNFAPGTGLPDHIERIDYITAEKLNYSKLTTRILKAAKY